MSGYINLDLFDYTGLLGLYYKNLAFSMCGHFSRSFNLLRDHYTSLPQFQNSVMCDCGVCLQYFSNVQGYIL